MIAKCILQDNHEALLQSVGGNFATLINTDSGVKSAASDVIPRSVIERFRPPMDKFATHIIAMGDEEHYGPNRNGDSWPGDGLAKNAYTFVSNGHLFREHNNSHPDKAIGEIKYAAYDPQLGRVELLVWGDKNKAAKEWEHMKKGNALSGSMSARVPWDECSVCGNRAKTPREYCFTPDTLITMADGARKPISDIKIGDTVMSSSGYPTKVTQLFRRDVDEEICHIKTSINGRVIRTTKNHPILALPADVAHFLGIYNGCSKNLTMNYLPCGSLRKEFSSIKIEPAFVDAESLVPHDIVFSPVLKNIDGSESDLDVEEAWVLGLFTAEGSFAKRSNGDRNSVQFSLHEDESVLIERLAKFARTKFDRDLKVYSREDSKGISCRIHSKEAADYFYRHCGEYAQQKKVPADVINSTSYDVVRAYLTGLFDGDGCYYDDKRYLARLNSSSRDLVDQVYEMLCRYSDKNYRSQHINPAGPKERNSGDSRRLPAWYVTTNFFDLDEPVCKETHAGYIKTLQFEWYKGPVLNFETEDHTYVAEGIAVHNCNHAAHHMGQYLPEHKKYAFVRNPHPKFFDYSFVEHPADSIAWGIEYDPNIAKAASISWTSNICNGSDLARAMGITFPDEQTSDPLVLKFASLEDDMRMIARTGASTSSYQFIKGASEAVRDISDHEIVSFRKAKPHTVFYELAKAGCVLPFESFCAYALNKTASAVKSMPSVKKASLDILPLIYYLLKETTGLDETIGQYRNDMAACRDDATCSCDPGRPDVIDSLMNSADEKFNMGDDAMKNRITVTIIKFGSSKATSIIPVCTESEQYEAMKLASWYAAYQMQAVEDIARFHGASFAEKVARYLVAQNVSSIAL